MDGSTRSHRNVSLWSDNKITQAVYLFRYALNPPKIWSVYFMAGIANFMRQGRGREVSSPLRFFSYTEFQKDKKSLISK